MNRMTLQEIIQQLQHALKRAEEAANRGDGARGYIDAYSILSTHVEIVTGELMLRHRTIGGAS